LLIFLIGCNKSDEEYTPKVNSDIDESISFSVIWDKEINNSSSDAIFFEKYFIIPDFNEINVYSKESGELIAEIEKDLISDYFTSNLKIVGDVLYTYNFKKGVFIKYNLLTNKLTQSDFVDNAYTFIVDDNYIYYAAYDAVVKVDFELNLRDTLFTFKDIKKGYFTNYIEMGIYNSDEDNKKYLAFSYREANGHIDSKFNIRVIDLNTKYPILIKSFNTNDNIYNFSIKGNDLCISSMQLIYIYNFKDKDYYFVNSNHTYNFSRDVNILNEDLLKWQRKLMYNDALEYNCYNFSNGNIEWTIKNRYIEDVSNIKLKSDYYLNLLKANSLNIVEIKTGKIRAEFEYVKDGNQKYFRECSDVFNGNQVILRQGNDRIVKVLINKI